MLYSEEQRMKFSTRWYLIVCVISIIIASTVGIVIKHLEEMEGFAIIIMLVMTLFMVAMLIYVSSLQLSIRVYNHGISYQVLPIIGEWKNISKSDITSYKIESGTFSVFMKTRSKHRMKMIGKNKRYAVLGNALLTLELKDNKKLSLSTLQPQQLEQVLQKMMQN